MLNLGSIRTTLEERIWPGAIATAEPSATRVAAPWRGTAAQAAGMWLATRLALLLFTFFAVLFGGHVTPAQLAGFPAHTLLYAWQRWDGGWYTHIAQDGYFSEQATAFFPLYPLLTGGVSFVLGGSHALLAAMIVSNLAALA